MTCKEINQALTQRFMASPLTPETEDHLRACVSCRKLVAALTVPVVEAWPAPAVLHRIEATIAADLRCVRPIAPKSYIFAALMTIFIACVAWGISRNGAFAVVMSLLQTSAMIGVLATSIGLLAYSLVNQMVPGSRHRLSPKLLPFGITMSLMSATAILFPFQDEQNFWAASWACIRAGGPIGGLTAVPLWLVLRRGTILGPVMTGATTGLLAGLAGTTALEITCPNLNGWHILVGHLGVVAFSAMTGFFLGGTVAALRAHRLNDRFTRACAGRSHQGKPSSHL
jgi:hypothetical protein